MLILQKRDPEKTIDHFYDKESLLFKETASEHVPLIHVENKPHCVFLTNQDIITTLVKYFLHANYISLYRPITHQNYANIESLT